MAINSNTLESGTHTVATNGTAVNGKTVNGHEIESNGHGSIQTNGATSTHGAVPVNGSNGHHNGADDYMGMIAVCGMALRLPGGLMKPQDFWDFLLAKGDARGRVPASRYNVDSYHSRTAQSGTVKTEYGYFLDDESVKLDSLDASLFSMPKAELERADPHQRQMLEVARECFEDAGVTGWGGSRTGCYMGSFGEDWCEIFAKEPQQYGLYRVSGFGDFMLANRVSYEMDLRGPSMTVRTGCSAALVAMHEACRAIQHGDCDSALVGGANLILAPGMTTAMTEQGVLASDGACKTFSAEANGYARGEAITAVFLKPVEAALRDGNPIRAVIRATATNSDGRTPGISCPSGAAHESMMRHAYGSVGLDPRETAFAECHGTGTQIGDPIETNAVGRVFGGAGDDSVYIGSVKPNMGHSEGASGLTSLIKMVLALEHQTIPPNIRFETPNPKIGFGEHNMIVPTIPQPWPRHRKERASVNSFGIGGSNAHVVVESARSLGLTGKDEPLSNGQHEEEDAHLLLFSAATETSLTQLGQEYARIAEQQPSSLRDIAYTLAMHREYLAHRAFAVARTGQALTVSLSAKAATGNASNNVVFVFAGQGAQWPQMGSQLIQKHSVFRNAIQSFDAELQRMPNPPAWSIEEELCRPADTSRVQVAEFAQPLTTAVQMALADMLAAVGVKPHAVIGHSSGEVAAAYAAGSLTAYEAMAVSSHRGMVTRQQRRKGGMAAIGLSWDATTPYLLPGVTIACENSPTSVTISGDVEALGKVVAAVKLAQPDVLARLLQVDQAYHSYHMAEVGDEYFSHIAPLVQGSQPKNGTLFFSSVSGRLLESKQVLGPKYWQINLESPVLFRTALAELINHPIGKNAVFVDMGPHSTLAGPVRQILAQAGTSAPFVPTMIRNADSTDSFLSALGQLYQSNVSLDLSETLRGGRCIGDLPRYPWNHDASHWYESRLSKSWRNKSHPHHDLLGSRTLESSDLEPTWRNLIQLESSVSWIRDHKIRDDVVFPIAAYTAMAGEAVRQLTGEDNGYSLRQAVVSTALVMPEGRTTEVMTTLRRHRLTDDLLSEWWEFSIASTNASGVWTQHCAGRVKAMGSKDSSAFHASPESMMRKVDARRWYDTMSRSGLNYGPHFQGLESIRASVAERQAYAMVANTPDNGSDQYHLHPTVIDVALQLLSVANAQGVSTKLTNTFVPTRIESLTITRSDAALEMVATTQSLPSGGVRGSIQAASGSLAALQIDGITLSPLQGMATDAKPDTHATSRLEWGQHIDFMDVSSLIRPSVDRSKYTPLLDELLGLCIVQSRRLLASSDAHPSLPHLQKFKDWIFAYAQTSLEPWQTLSAEDITKRVGETMEKLSNTPAAVAATALDKVRLGIAEVFAGEADPLGLLLADGTLTELYNFTDQCDRSHFLQRLGHSKPNLRILEIGAGTGATTANMLKDLVRADGEGPCSYSKYTYTDISAGFFGAARERFAHMPNMEYTTLDITKDPADQGLEEGSYDLVIATNVLHATESLSQTLANVRELLNARGRLLLQELSPTSKWINFIFGLLPGWWEGEADGRPNEPYISPAQWFPLLRGAGFSDIAGPVFDSEEPFQLNAMIVASPTAITAPAAAHVADSEVEIVALEKEFVSQSLVQALQDKGFHVGIHSFFFDTIPKGRPVLAVLEDQKPFFDEMTPTKLERFQRLMEGLGDAPMLWVTQPSQVECIDPRFGHIIGTARTLRSELSVQLATCEVARQDDDSWDAVIDIFTHFTSSTSRSSDNVEDLSPDYEFSIQGGRIFVGRYQPFSMQKETEPALVQPNDKRTCLKVGRPGLIDSLQWLQCNLLPLADDSVEVDIYSVGLNFRDVLSTLGLVNVPKAGLGLEASGIVRKKGVAVTNLNIGDRVMFFGGGSFSNVVTTSAQLCQRIPDSLGFDEAATMPCVYGTAIYCLITIGNLKRGESVLIHSACGGVGIAAIQLARMLGVEIYATVGNEKKVQYLIDTFGIPRNRIFHSRDDSFIGDLKRETGGKGVDLVLNSLSGELLHASWECVAEFGKMVEIGKKDILGAGKLDMSPFLANRSYCCIDLDEICSKRPAICSGLLRDMVEYYNQGHIQPISPLKTFSASSIQDAFRYMQKGQHLGKIVVSIRKNADKDELDASDAIAQEPMTLRLDESASYLLVGGLGGLGRSVASWMVEHNARHLICLSRSAGSRQADLEFVHELQAQGCTVQLQQGSVTEWEDVKRAMEQANAPVKGILQMSMVLRDQAFLRMSHEEWREAVDPKVLGTWNLHHAAGATGQTLDFFVLFSSMSATIGQPGQANYSAANAFLAAFAQYRRRFGLAASVVDIGAMEEVGYISQNEELLRKMKSTAAYGLSEQELLDAMTLAIVTSKPSEASKGTSSIDRQFVAPAQQQHFVLGMCSTIPLRESENRALWRKDRRMGVFHNTSAREGGGTSSSSSSDGALMAFLATARAQSDVLQTAEACTLIANELGRKLFDMLLKPMDDLDLSRPLSDMGMDSLVAVEMRSWWKQVFKVDISVLEMLGQGSLQALGELAAERLAMAAAS